jgi:hypothetical protein
MERRLLRIGHVTSPSMSRERHEAPTLRAIHLSVC